MAAPTVRRPERPHLRRRSTGLKESTILQLMNSQNFARTYMPHLSTASNQYFEPAFEPVHGGKQLRLCTHSIGRISECAVSNRAQQEFPQFCKIPRFGVGRGNNNGTSRYSGVRNERIRLTTHCSVGRTIANHDGTAR